MRLRPCRSASHASLRKLALERGRKNGQGMRMAGGAYGSGAIVAFAPQLQCCPPGLCRGCGLGRFQTRRPLAHSCPPERITPLELYAELRETSDPAVKRQKRDEIMNLNYQQESRRLLRMQVKDFIGVQLEVGLNKSSAESAEQQSPGRKPWDQA
jgi:hypothetical protein